MSDKLNIPENGPIVNETKVVPFGYELLGIDPDVQEETDVYQIKKHAAEMIEILKKSYMENRHPMTSLLFDHAVGEVLNASMSVVKVVTFKK